MNKLDVLHEWVKLNSDMLFMLKERTDVLFRRSEDNRKLIGSLSELIELDSELLKKVEEEIEKDQIEMADDFTEQLDSLKQEIQKLNALQSPPDK